MQRFCYRDFSRFPISPGRSRRNVRLIQQPLSQLRIASADMSLQRVSATGLITGKVVSV
jgi:hypothetical protein